MLHGSHAWAARTEARASQGLQEDGVQGATHVGPSAIEAQDLQIRELGASDRSPPDEVAPASEQEFPRPYSTAHLGVLFEECKKLLMQTMEAVLILGQQLPPFILNFPQPPL